MRPREIALRTTIRKVGSCRPRAITLLTLALLATSARAQTAVSEPKQEVNAHVGVIHHDEGQSIAPHVLFGARVVAIRRGPLGFGFAVDWWPERYGLGPTFDDRQVVGDYLAYAVEMELNFRGPLNGDFVLTSGLGAETVRFGERYEAEAIFPKRSTSPAISLGIGSRFPMTLDRALMLRLDLRARGVMAEVFDPTGVTSGREPTLSLEMSLGLSYMGTLRLFARAPRPPKPEPAPAPLPTPPPPVEPTPVVTPPEHEPAPVITPPAPEPAPAALATIYFDFAKGSLRSDAAEILDRHVLWLEANPSIRIRIEGHTDARGSTEYNLALGQRRARTARQYLIARGIAEDRFEIVSYGEERPACIERPMATACHRQNRRAEFPVILPLAEQP